MSETVLQGGRYRLLRRHGAGGLGDVWLASDERLHRSVAIKVLRRSTPELLTRFRQEALATAALEHPNIVRIVDYFVENESPYLVMELLEGMSLSELVHSVGCLEPRRAAMLLAQVASALDFAHARGVIHRDVKPANIQIVPSPTGEIAKVLDFGIAKLSGKTSVTADGTVVGTPAFMAPEQTMGAVADRRSDVFSAGVTLYFALAARLPYPGATPQEIHAQVTAGVREPLWRVRPDLDAGLYQIVDRATRHAPAERFTSAGELRDALERWLAGVTEAMPPSVGSLPVMYPSGYPAPNEPAGKRRGRGLAIAVGLLVAFGGLIAFGATGVAGLWLYQSGSLDAPATDPAPLTGPGATPTTPTSPIVEDHEPKPGAGTTTKSVPTAVPTTASTTLPPPPSATTEPTATPGTTSTPAPDAGTAGAPTAAPSAVPTSTTAPGKLCQTRWHCGPSEVCCRPPVWGCPAGFRSRCAPCAQAPGHQMCGSKCVRTAYDSKNCGACGNVCPAGTECSAAQCKPPAPPP